MTDASRSVVVRLDVRPWRPADGTLRLKIEDTSRTDDPARLVLEFRIAFDPELREVVLGPFEVPDDPHAVPTVWGHLDLSGTGKITPGDYISVEAHPLPPRGMRLRLVLVRI